MTTIIMMNLLDHSEYGFLMRSYLALQCPVRWGVGLLIQSVFALSQKHGNLLWGLMISLWLLPVMILGIFIELKT